MTTVLVLTKYAEGKRWGCTFYHNTMQALGKPYFDIFQVPVVLALRMLGLKVSEFF